MTTYVPTKPWQPTKVDISKNVLGLLIALVVSFVVVQLTPMKGKLAYAGVLFISATAIQVGMKWISRGRMAAIDGLASSIAFTGSVIVFLPVVNILYTTISKGVKGLHWTLFTDSMQNSSYLDPIGMGGILHAIVGTMYMIIMASVISVPLSILTALYLTEIKGRFTAPIRFLVQAMSGVPSIVAGLFILSAVLYPITKAYSGLMGSLALTILMIPTIARTSEEVLNLIPNDLREAGTALGGTQWRTVAMIVLPAAKSGLVTAIILGVARIAGETAPILLLTGGGDKVNPNAFDGPMGSLPYYIWKSFNAGSPEAITRAWAGLLVLVGLVLILFTSARFLGTRKAAK